MIAQQSMAKGAWHTAQHTFKNVSTKRILPLVNLLLMGYPRRLGIQTFAQSLKLVFVFFYLFQDSSRLRWLYEQQNIQSTANAGAAAGIAY